jgi:uncharacterized membrane protein (DUF4010 family)
MKYQGATEQLKILFGLLGTEAGTAAGSGNDCVMAWHGLILLKNPDKEESHELCRSRTGCACRGFFDGARYRPAHWHGARTASDAAAGLRTFALVAMLGCLFALLGEKTGGPWLLATGLLVIAGSMIASNFSAQQEEQYRGFTSEAAIVITYALGAAVWFGYATLAVMLAITTTVLLYFKAELRQFSERTTPKDINSILQFAVLSLVILPILPSEDFGPYKAINPRQIWYMVVLISGLALAGYLALRIVGSRYGAALLGIFGGLASSTATTMMFSRHAREHADLVRMSAIVILIANVMVMIRIGIVASIVAPTLILPIVTVFACGIVPGIALTAYRWRALASAGACRCRKSATRPN